MILKGGDVRRSEGVRKGKEERYQSYCMMCIDIEFEFTLFIRANYTLCLA